MSDEPEEDEWALKSTDENSGAHPTASEVATNQARASRTEPDRHPADSEMIRREREVTRRLQAISDTKVAILGATMSGKSYLFQAMTYRASNPARSGSLKVFLGNEQAEIFEADGPHEDFRMLQMRAFNAKYKQWGRLPPTNVSAQRWYKLLLRYRTGWFGLRRAEMCIDFLDASGEALQEDIALMDPDMREMFASAYLPARVAIFCLPMWVAFPDAGLRLSLEEIRKKALDGFYKIIHNFKRLRHDREVNHPIQSILALTQADDRRCAFTEMRDFWIEPYLRHAAEKAILLGSQRGLMEYLRDARVVSDSLMEQFRFSEKNDIQKIPFELQFNGQLPMIVPLSAIDGSKLDLHSPSEIPATPTPSPVLGAALPPRREHKSLVIDPGDPIPAHVELPLLFALCEQHNALM